MANRFVLLAVICLGYSSTECSAQATDENRNYVMTARCRASCLNKFPVDSSTAQGEQNRFQRWSCWMLCQKLYSDNSWRHDCNDSERCLPGCQQSCHFYSTHSELIEATRTDTVFKESLAYKYDSMKEAITFRWPRPVGNDQIEPLVYVLMAESQTTGNWIQLEQTSYLNATVRKLRLKNCSRLLLTAYDSNGKVAEIEKPFQSFTLQQWGPTLKYLEAEPNVADVTEESTEDVKAVISWPELPNERVWYYLQWKEVEPSAGAIEVFKTAGTTAVISLQPGKTYKVTLWGLGTKLPSLITEADVLYVRTASTQKVESRSALVCYDEFCVSYLGIAFILTTLSAFLLLLNLLKLNKHIRDQKNELCSIVVPEKMPLPAATPEIANANGHVYAVGFNLFRESPPTYHV